jgi:hypothetical protein
MADLRGFAKKMHVTAEAIPKNADKLVRTVALSVQAAVAMGTPVRTGQARRNWQTGLDEAPAGTLPPPSTPGAGAMESIAAAEATVKGYVGGRSDASIHITNNLPYIVRLDNGWSEQATVGYVQRAALKAADAVNGATLVKTDGN